jgi:hypothetical protein
MCGIVPTDLQLVPVVEGFALIEDASIRPEHISVRPMLEAIGVPESMILSIDSERMYEAHNEAIILMCPFLPLPGSSMWKICTTLFKAGTRSVF